MSLNMIKAIGEKKIYKFVYLSSDAVYKDTKSPINEESFYLNLIKKIQLADCTFIEYYENLQIRKDQTGKVIVKYLQTTTGRAIFNYTIQKTLNIL